VAVVGVFYYRLVAVVGVFLLQAHGGVVRVPIICLAVVGVFYYRLVAVVGMLLLQAHGGGGRVLLQVGGGGRRVHITGSWWWWACSITGWWRWWACSYYRLMAVLGVFRLHVVAVVGVFYYRLVAVVGVFLIVEFPLALLFIVYIAENMAGVILLDPATAATASIFVNLCILLSYPVNFFIYCGMSKQFRDTFKSLFGCDGRGGGGDCSGGGRVGREGRLVQKNENHCEYTAMVTVGNTDVLREDDKRNYTTGITTKLVVDDVKLL